MESGVPAGTKSAVKLKPLDEPFCLAGTLGLVCVGPVDLLGYPGGDEPEQARAFRHRRLDDGLPLLERGRGAARELMRAVRAHARVAVAHTSSHASIRRISRARPAVSLVRSSAISPSSSTSYRTWPAQSGRCSGRQAWMPLRQGSTVASTQGPAPPFGSGQLNPVKTLVPSGLRNL